MRADELHRLSDQVAALTGAGPAFLYSTHPTPGATRVYVLSDGVKYTMTEAWVRLTQMLADAEAGRGWFYCRVCQDATQRTYAERDTHEENDHTLAQLQRAGVVE